MKKKFLIILFLAGLLVVKSCKKDPIAAEKKDTPFTTTPYTFVLQPGYPPLKLPIDNPLTEQGVMLGRMLFHDPILSGDSTLSCSNCHQQSKGFADPRKVSVGITGQLGNRNSMPLNNLMWNNHFFWDARAKTLKEQVLMPIQAHDEMNINLYRLIEKLERTPRYQSQFKEAFNVTNIEPYHISLALEQFIVTLISFNAPIDKLLPGVDTLTIISPAANRGLKLFYTPAQNGGADCFHCHGNIFFGNNSINGSMANNGLDAVITDPGFGNITGRSEDIGKFKIPSLRNVERSAPYMHDGRFQTLQEVLNFYSDNIQYGSPNLDINLSQHAPKQMNLSVQQKSDIIEFLKTLTDTSYLNNAAFKTPF